MTIAALIHSGHNTHSHDHVITPVSFSIINKRPRASTNPRPCCSYFFFMPYQPANRNPGRCHTPLPLLTRYICAAFLKLPSCTPVHLAKVWLSIDDLVPGVWERIVENRNQMRVRIFKGGHLRGGILPLYLIHWKRRFSVFLCFGHIVLHYYSSPGPRTPLFHKVNSYTPLLD